MINIKNCFNIGYRCNTDTFLIELNIRKYSSPFSYMVIDLETSLNFIKVNFKDFFKVIKYKSYEQNFKWNGPIWTQSDLYFNIQSIPKDTNIDITNMKKICCWNHHNLSDKNIISSIQRRINHLLSCLKSNENTLLMYVSNINRNIQNTNYLIDLCNNFINSKHTFFCILVPLIEYENSPTLCKINEYINLIYYKSNTEGHINDIDNSKIRWDLIKNIIRENYDFNIQLR
jgi:hypothetical protein